MNDHTRRERYPLRGGFPWLLCLFGGFLAYAALEAPIARMVTMGEIRLEEFSFLLFAVPMFAFIWRFTGIYIELTDDALLIRGVLTRRIPLSRITSVAVPGPRERVEWTQLIQPHQRLWGPGWASGHHRLLLIQIGTERVAIEFSDPAPVYDALTRRLEALRSKREAD